MCTVQKSFLYLPEVLHAIGQFYCLSDIVNIFYDVEYVSQRKWGAGFHRTLGNLQADI